MRQVSVVSLFISLVCAATPLLVSRQAGAQNATWLSNPGSNNFNTGANWSTGTVPTGTATFGASNTTSIGFGSGTEVGGFTFDAGAPAYSFTIPNALQFTGAGIVNNSGNAPTLTLPRVPRILGARLQLFNSATLGNAVVTVSNRSFVNFADHSSPGTATITAFGGVRFQDASSARKARLNAIDQGSVQFSNTNSTAGSIEGDGNFYVGSGRLTVGTNNLSTSLAGSLHSLDGSSLASVVKVGRGTLTLRSGFSPLGSIVRMALDVNRGAVMLNRRMDGSVTVGPRGAFGGAGILEGSLENSGILAFSGFLEPLTIVDGNFSQTPGGTFQVAVNADGQNSSLNIGGGSAALAGAVQVMAAPGSYKPKTSYTILTAEGGITGRFSSVTSNLAFLTPSLSYDANDVFLTLMLTNAAFASAARNPNQAAVGRVLDQAYPTATGDFGNVLNAIAGLSTAQAPAVLGAIGGQNYSGFSTTAVQTARVFMTSFADQTRGRQGAGHIALAQACEVACDADQPSRWGAWGGVLGSLGTVAGDANAFGTTYSLGGFAGGLDYRFNPNFLAGVTAGYSNATLYTQAMPGQGNSSTVQLGLYGKFTEGPIYVDGLAGYAHSDNRMTRLIVIPGLAARTAYGATGAGQFFGLLETGYRVELGGRADAFVTPFAALQGSTSTQAGFTESGADSLNLSVAQQTTNSLRTVFGGEIGGGIDLGWHDKLNLALRLGWSHEFADTARPVTASFVGAPTLNFTTRGAAAPRDGAVVSLGATTSVAAATSIYLRYDGDMAGGNTSHTLSAGLRMTW